MALVVLTVMLAMSRAQAANFTVTTVAANGSGSLWQAVLDSNAAGGSNFISFASGLSGTIVLSDQLFVTSNLTIQGPSATAVALSGGGATRILNTYGAISVSVSRLGFVNGFASTGQGGGGAIINGAALTLRDCYFANNSAESGGAIFQYNSSSFANSTTATNCTFSGNSATVQEGGAVLAYTSGLSFSNCTFIGNSAVRDGGAIRHFGNGTPATNLSLSSCTISGNSAGGGAGGIFDNSGSSNPGVQMNNTIIAGNTDTSNSPDAFANIAGNYNLIGNGTGAVTAGIGNLKGVDPKFGPLVGSGATRTLSLLAISPAINAGDPALSGGTDQRGVARSAGGRPDIGAYEFEGQATPNFVVTTLADEDDGTADPNVGAGTSLREAVRAANANADYSIVGFKSGLAGTITLSLGPIGITTDMTVAGPTNDSIVVSGGGTSGIFSVEDAIVTVGLTHLRMTSGNSTNPNGGGAITMTGRGNLTLSFCTLSGNRASRGGGLSNTFGTVSLNSCTVSGNTATNGNGGGVYNAYGALSITNSTLSGNAASASGGGLYNTSGGSATLFNCTLSGNTATVAGGAIRNISPSTLSVTSATITGNTATQSNGGGISNASTANAPVAMALRNSIVTGNTAPFDADFSGPAQGNYNLVGAVSNYATLDGTGNLIGADAKLGVLADNGGPTLTHQLLLNSAALNVGDPALNSGTDQRGVSRASFGRADIGAFELDGVRQEQLTVTTTTDEDNGTSDPSMGTGTSLREAINYANGLVGTNVTILFKAPLFDTAQTIQLGPNKPLVVTGNVTINARSGTGARTLTIIGLNETRLFTVNAGGTLSLTGLTLSRGGAQSAGGAILNQGTLNLTSCYVSGSRSSDRGGGVYSTGALTIKDSAFGGNVSYVAGGAIATGGGTLTISNTTFSSNITYGVGGGGALDLAGGAATLDSCTLSGNNAGNYPSGGILLEAGTLKLGNSIVAANSPRDISVSGGTLTDDGYNLIGENFGVETTFPAGLPNSKQSYVGTSGARLDPRLGRFASSNSGQGLVPVMALLPGSRAIDNGKTTLAADARGVKRPFGRNPDIGAYEFDVVLNESLVVTTLTDEDDGTSDPIYGMGTSLREAANYSNALVSVGAPVITFKAGLTGTINLSKTLLFSARFELQGPGASVITLSGAPTPGTNPVGPTMLLIQRLASEQSVLTAKISGLTLAGASATNSNGGAIGLAEGSSLNVERCTFSGNKAKRGGAIYRPAGVSLSVADSLFSGNSASDGADGGGGAIYSGGNYGGSTFVSGSTFTGNARALENAGFGSTTVYNSTFNGNGGTLASALYNTGDTSELVNCTIVGNSLSPTAGGAALSSNGTTNANGSGTIKVRNSIVVDNAGGDVKGTLVSEGTNLIGTGDLTAFGKTDKTGVTRDQLKIGELADNGGPTQTMALQIGSIAINKGSLDGAFSTASVDQRGVTRPKMSRADIGAYEYDGAVTESLVVTTLTDEDDGTTDVRFGTGTSLREAANYAKAQSANGGAQTVTFAPELKGTITVLSTPIVVGGATNLVGPSDNSIIVSGGGRTRLFSLSDGAEVAMSHLNINDSGGVLGNAIYNYAGKTLSVTRCNFSNNVAKGSGGAIYNVSGTVTVVNCNFTGNRSTDAEFGSGAAIFSGAETPLTVSGSTFSGNSGFYYGGAIIAVSNGGGSANISSSTFSGNSVSGAEGAGGAIMGGAVKLNVTNCTFSGNSASVKGGAIYVEQPVETTINSSILSGNSAPSGPDFLGAANGSNNLLSNDAGATLNGSANLLNVDAKLDVLKDNGGPTKTIALLRGSAALDKGAAGTSNSDQRGDGFARVRNGRADIGAFETQNTKPEANAQSVEVAQNSAVEITLTGSDPDNGTLSFRVTVQPLHGTLTGEAPNLVYAPAANYAGPDEFSFIVDDGFYESDPAVVSINVTEINAIPLLVDDFYETNENVALVFPATALLANDSAGEADQTLTVTAIGAPSHGTAQLGNDGNVTYTPETDYSGTDMFSYTVMDNGTTNGAPDPKMASAQVNINVRSVNQAPKIAVIADQEILANADWTLTASATDRENNVVTWSFDGDVPDGLTIDEVTGEMKWTPLSGQVGEYDIVIKATDNGVPIELDTTSFKITVLLGGGGTTTGGTSTGGTSTGGTSTGGTDTSGTSTGGTSTGGTDTGGTSTGGTDTSGTSTGGTSTGGTDTSGTSTGGTSTGGTDTSGTSTGGTSTGGTDTSGTSTGGTSTGGTDTSGTSTGGTSTGGTSTGGTSTGGTSTGGTDTSGTSTGGTSTGGTSTGGTSTSGTSTGETSTGGTSTGGTSTSGTSTGETSTGGTSTSGTSTGGTSTGGTSTSGTSTGGTSTGGTSTGGTSTSGTSTGGTSTGGTSTGGTDTSGTSTGGTSTSGTSTGGTSTSGTSTGGTSTGGTSTGGTSTGGTSTGGTSTGGTSTGGTTGGGPKKPKKPKKPNPGVGLRILKEAKRMYDDR